MPGDRLETVQRHFAALFGEESLGERARALLGKTFPLAQAFQEEALEKAEALIEQTESYLVALATRRAKLLEHISSGLDWEDLDEVRETLAEFIADYSDELSEEAEGLILWMEDRRAEIEDSCRKQPLNPRECSRLSQWIERKTDQARELVTKLLEQFDSEANEISEG